MKKCQKITAAMLSVAMLGAMWGSGLPVRAQEAALHVPLPSDFCVEYVNPDMGWGDTCRLYYTTLGIYPALYYVSDYRFNYVSIAADPDSVSTIYTLCTEIGFDAVTVSDTDRVICYDDRNSEGAVSVRETDFTSKQEALTEMLKHASAAGCQLQSALYNECRCSYTPVNGQYLDVCYVSGIPAGEADALLQIAAAYDTNATVEEAADGSYTIHLKGFMEACDAETDIRAAYDGAAVKLEVEIREERGVLTTDNVNLLEAAGISTAAGEPLHVPVPWEDGIEYVNPDMYERVYYRESSGGSHVAVMEDYGFNRAEFTVDPADAKAVAAVCETLDFDYVTSYSSGTVVCCDCLDSNGERSSDETDFTSKLAALTDAVRVMRNNGYAIESAVYNECVVIWSPACGWYSGPVTVDNIPAGEEENLRQIVAAYDAEAEVTVNAEGGYKLRISDFFVAMDAEKAVRAAYPDATVRLGFIRTMLASWLKTEDIDLLEAAGVTAHPTLTGDLNLDSNIDLIDAVLLGKANADSITLNSTQKANADVDKSGTVDTEDTLTLLRFLLRLETSIG